MPKPSAIVTAVAALMNDAAQTQYTNTAVLPYLNIALDNLQELYELNELPVTTRTSPVITLKSGINRVGYDTNPALPANLIEIEQLWESPAGINEWTPVVRKDLIPHYLEDNTTISQFLLWSWENDHIKLIAANSDNDLKIDGIFSIFNTPILIGNINVNLPFVNIKTYLEYKTAALCAMFVAENPERAQALNQEAMTALDRALGIPVKGQQPIVFRRRPFRHSFKHRGISY